MTVIGLSLQLLQQPTDKYAAYSRKNNMPEITHNKRKRHYCITCIQNALSNVEGWFCARDLTGKTQFYYKILGIREYA